MYSDAFKAEAVRQVVELGHPVQQVAARLKIPCERLTRWLEVSALQPDVGSTHKADPIYQENLRLKRELKEIKEERDVLKRLVS